MCKKIFETIACIDDGFSFLSNSEMFSSNYDLQKMNTYWTYKFTIFHASIIFMGSSIFADKSIKATELQDIVKFFVECRQQI